ncbi:MAG: alkaline phosphatase family protein [Leptospiraceae bacterium]|nr:alkaline phosphatase family protein [Leptospiraceae bacterium]
MLYSLYLGRHGTVGLPERADAGGAGLLPFGAPLLQAPGRRNDVGAQRSHIALRVLVAILLNWILLPLPPGNTLELAASKSVFGQDRFIALPARAPAKEQPDASPKTKTLIVVLDGVRSEEIFIGAWPWAAKRSRRLNARYLLPFLWQNLARRPGSLVLGNRWFYKHHQGCSIDNPSGRSLPAYSNMLGSAVQSNVIKNDFRGVIEHPGVLDTVRRSSQTRNRPAPWAVFASWQPIANVVSQNPDSRVHIDTGWQRGLAKPPWHHARYDRDTWLAVRKWIHNTPEWEYLFVAFNDTDEWGHFGAYQRYLRALQDQDRYIGDIVRLIEQETGAEQLNVLITTDHGRGRGRYWRQHGTWLRGPRHIWLMAHLSAHSGLDDALRQNISEQLRNKCTHNTIARISAALLSRD